MSEPMTQEWWIGLSGWVLQDGSYTDFVAGETRQFALEFVSYGVASLQPVAERRALSCRHANRDSTYDVTADVVRSALPPNDHVVVLDFGLAAYMRHLALDGLGPPARGTQVAGEISLHVDHFAYFRMLADLPGMPALIRTWTILEVQVNTSPWIQVDYGDPRYGSSPGEGPRFVGDPDRESWRSIDRTRMWDDERGLYRLRCALLPHEPTRTMAASGSRSPYGPML